MGRSIAAGVKVGVVHFELHGRRPNQYRKRRRDQYVRPCMLIPGTSSREGGRESLW